MQKFKVLIVDDDYNFLDYIKNVFSNENEFKDDFELTTINNPENAIKELLKKEFHIIILDFYFLNSSLDGIDICNLIRNSYMNRDSYIIAISCESDKEKQLGIYNSALFDDFLYKMDVDHRMLVSKLKAVVRREYKGYDGQRFIIKKRNYKYTLNDKEIPLTNTEFKILKIIALGKKDYHSSLDICEIINEEVENEVNNPSTIRVHVKNIRKKISLNCGTDFITTIAKKGYITQNVSIMDFDS